MSDDPELDKLYKAYRRAANAAIAAEDAGRPDAKLNAAMDRAQLKLSAARRGEPAKKSAKQIECETNKAIARAYEERTGNKLNVQKEGTWSGNFTWYAYHWVPGDAPTLTGPFRTELAACRALLDWAK
jgi:hypothetical protein